MSEGYTFDPVQVDPGGSRKVVLDLFDQCANFWRENEQWSLGEFIRPPLATGFAYECTTEGTSAHRPPVFPRTIGQTVEDGSAVWTCRAAGTNGLNAISGLQFVSDPTGLTISGVSVDEATKILATYSAGTLGQDYDAVYTFTLNGVTRVARQTVQVRKR
jgi:hypothetical protein